jgi:hypothetical protein
MDSYRKEIVSSITRSNSDTDHSEGDTCCLL